MPRQSLIDNLRQVQSSVTNAQGAGSGMHERLSIYGNWATAAANILGNLISPEDVRRLVFTDGYYRCMAAFQFPASLFGVANALINAEYADRVRAFNELLDELKLVGNSWGGAMVFLMDTGVYIQYPDKFPQIDYQAMLGTQRLNLLLAIPMVVVDQLDRLKQHPTTRGRAQIATAAIAGAFTGHTRKRVMIGGGFVPITPAAVVPLRIEAQLLLDPPGHVRLADDDEEIVDRTLALQILSGERVKLVTYDAGMALRADAVGLDCLHLPPPAEAAPVESTRARRRRQQEEREATASAKDEPPAA